MPDANQAALQGGAHAHGAHGHDGAHGVPHNPNLQHHFIDMPQQQEASTLGMWIFLVTEVMFFGGMFLCYILFRYWNPEGFAGGSHHLDLKWGFINTLVLIVSSLTMALAVRSAQLGNRKGQIVNLILTMILGTAFLGIKAIEYAAKFRDHVVPGTHFEWHEADPTGAQQFFSIYFAMTGLHALHMIVGLGIMTVILIMAWRGRFNETYYTPVEVSGLYWHFVDIVWIFLFPLLYLLGRH
ncbi:MAG: cytochrome c oxidase subunit 3 family protein [Acidobacteriota bacterium]|nr:cytochrome c oxidase subunit 3 family protein [Acidobacteriota bacterium]